MALRGSFLLFFSFCFIIIANGQELHATKRDSIMLENNIAYARHIDRLMPDSSRLILNQVLEKSMQLGLQKTHFRALLGLTQNFEAHDEYGKSDSLLAIIARSPLVFSDATYHIEYLLRMSHHLELLHLIDSSTVVSERNAELSRANNNYKLDEIYFMAGAANFNSGNYINAIKYYQAALELTDTTNRALQVQYNGYLGMIFLNLGQAIESLKYYQRALYFMDKTGQENTDILYGAGMCYFNLGQYKPAFEYLKSAIENPNEDWTYRFVGANSYLHYWKSAVKLHKENHNEIGMHFVNTINRSHFKFEAMQAEILMFYNKLEQAEKILFKGLEKLKENGAAQSMNLSFYALLAELYEKKNDTKKALFYHKLFFAINDSLRNENVQNEIVNLREQFQASQREATINELTNQVKVEKLEASLIKSRMRFTIILVLIGFGLIISTGIFIRYRQKLNIVKLQVENQDKEHEIEKILEQSKTNILSSSLKGQEKERARLAKEFHDNLGSRISALRYFVAAKKGFF